MDSVIISLQREIVRANNANTVEELAEEIVQMNLLKQDLINYRSLKGLIKNICNDNKNDKNDC